MYVFVRQVFSRVLFTFGGWIDKHQISQCIAICNSFPFMCCSPRCFEIDDRHVRDKSLVALLQEVMLFLLLCSSSSCCCPSIQISKVGPHSIVLRHGKSLTTMFMQRHHLESLCQLEGLVHADSPSSFNLGVIIVVSFGSCRVFVQNIFGTKSYVNLLLGRQVMFSPPSCRWQPTVGRLSRSSHQAMAYGWQSFHFRGM